MSESVYLTEQAASARALAEAANLPNVRARYLDAATAWAKLAARAEQLERLQGMPLRSNW